MDEFLTPLTLPAAAPEVAGTLPPFWQKLLTFVLTVIGGGTGKIKIPVGIQLPPFSLTDTINIFGRAIKITLKSDGANIVLEAGPG